MRKNYLARTHYFFIEKRREEAVGVTTATIYRELKRGETGELDKHFRPAYSAVAAEREVQKKPIATEAVKRDSLS